ncbi:hypothetical protein O6H91_07G045000 [Diphasiastrum complanatum]|uniref:Uncharacterized protein n=1 Tax=Diphasiastrum complanatum TaxID=34168 RepID=A0ACC2D4J3_DIPCM|nr:hypothetical protein O6H91_07G045000 [Diphasiastrum complanatum]
MFTSNWRRWCTMSWAVSEYTFNLIIFEITLIVFFGSEGERPHKHERALVLWNLFERMMLIAYGSRGSLSRSDMQYQEARSWHSLQDFVLKRFVAALSGFPRALMTLIRLKFSMDQDAPILYILCYVLLLLDLRFILLRFIAVYAIESPEDRDSEDIVVSPETELRIIVIPENKIVGVVSDSDEWGSEVQYGSNEEEARCCICLCAFQSGETVFQLSCNHQYHKVCIETWRRIDPRCPLCKQVLSNQAVEALLH